MGLDEDTDFVWVIFPDFVCRAMFWMDLSGISRERFDFWAEDQPNQGCQLGAGGRGPENHWPSATGDYGRGELVADDLGSLQWDGGGNWELVGHQVPGQSVPGKLTSWSDWRWSKGIV